LALINVSTVRDTVRIITESGKSKIKCLFIYLFIYCIRINKYIAQKCMYTVYI